MTAPKKLHKLPSFIHSLLAVLFWVGVWWLVALIYQKPALLPTPWRVLLRLVSLLRTGTFYAAVGTSLLHILIGLAAGCTVGILVGILVAFSRVSDTLLTPAFSVVRATPVVCFIIIAWLFVGTRALPSFISALMVAPVMMTSTAAAIRSVDPKLVEAARVYRLTVTKKIRALYLPSTLPQIRASLVTCVGLAWKSGIAAEVIALPKNSIGYEIWYEKSWQLDFEAVFAWTVTVVVFSLVLEKLVKLALAYRKGGRRVSQSV
ncbi:MAG: ABC transporter permease subunit [Clostridia bacterium]|nr:ABC transporter permease subunit [Clostridia bacterium]MDY6184331.1 ABC transporter permease subunit [Eubacteriales bacterium]